MAARLDKSKSYGVFWFNRTRTTRKKISVAGPEGREYRTRHYVRQNPREQWMAIPMPDAGIPREVADAAREMIRDNRALSNAGRRFWQLPVGAVYCGGCGMRMTRYAVPMKGRRYAYYQCSRLIRFGKDGCSPERLRTTHRADEVERRVWEFVSYLMKDSEELTKDLERMIELEKRGANGDPERESRAWLDRLAEVDTERRGYLKLAARGSMSEAELDQALGRARGGPRRGGEGAGSPPVPPGSDREAGAREGSVAGAQRGHSTRGPGLARARGAASTLQDAPARGGHPSGR